MKFYFLLLIYIGAFVYWLNLPDTDNIVPFENTTLINQNKGKNKRTQNRLIRLIEVIFLKGTMLSVLVMWRLSRLRSFSKTERNRYCDCLERVWLDCDAALTAWFWNDFKAHIRHEKNDPAVNYMLQCAPLLLCDDRLHPPANSDDWRLYWHCIAPGQSPPHLVTIPPANQQLL